MESVERIETGSQEYDFGKICRNTIMGRTQSGIKFKEGNNTYIQLKNGLLQAYNYK